MKIVITGASGFLGTELLKTSFDVDNELILIGRDEQVLNKKYPMYTCCTYSEMDSHLKGCDLLIHLAVLNNTANATAAEFDAVNVQLFQSVLTAAKDRQVKKFVNITSFHALSDAHQTEYAKSKRTALKIARETTDISIINVFLPAVYGQDFSGKLSILNKFPWAHNFVCALAPVVNVSRLAVFLQDALDGRDISEDVFLYDQKSENWVYRWVKRTLDLLFVAAIVIFAGWLLLIVWALVKFTSTGPGVFAQPRIGRMGTEFTCYKFRTMKLGTTQAGTHEVSGAAVTKVGSFLRKTKVDELPQVWNILKNEISLVGPRPCLPVQTDLIEARRAKGVLNVLPGITGLSQIRGIDMSDPDQLAASDALALAQTSLLSDLKIVIATFTGAGQGDKIKS